MSQIHFIYKTTNKLNGRYYIGAHSTNNFNDDYLGSGKLLLQAIELHGKENFYREIIEICLTKKELYEKEKEIISEDEVNNPGSYNLTVGGNMPPKKKKGSKCKDPNSWIFERMRIDNPSRLEKNREKHSKTTMMKDKDGKVFKMKLDDPRINSTDYTHINKDKVTVKDKDGNNYQVSKNDPRYKSGELVHNTKGLVLECPNCKKIGGNSMKRWHFNNCREKEVSV